MAVQLGSGEFTFEVNENWAKLPEDLVLGDVAAVGVDRHNRVFGPHYDRRRIAVLLERSRHPRCGDL